MSELFAGKYQLKKRLGVGGMAEVWLAELKGPQGFSRQLVIKRILPHLADDDNFITMFEDEARLAARLSHPHAVRVEEFAQDGDVWYLAMEYLDGGDLRQLTRRALTLGESVPMQVLLQMGGDVASALHHAHTLRGAQGQPLNMIHRDVSPHNILVTTQGQAKLVDFGIARAESNQVKTRTGMVKGKSGYMSPEQALGRTLDGRSDQFALAIVLYECALQARVFQGDNDLAIMRKVVACEIPAPISVDPTLPLGVSEVLEKALQRAPEDRFPTCEAFAKELFDCLDAAGQRGGHRPVAEWVQRMGEVEGKLRKLPGLDELHNPDEAVVEEVTRISRSRSIREPSAKSPPSPAAAGQLFSSSNPASSYASSKGSSLPLYLAGGLLLAGLAAFVLMSDSGEQQAPLDGANEASQIITEPAPGVTEIRAKPVTVNVIEPPTPSVPKPVTKPKRVPTKSKTAVKKTVVEPAAKRTTLKVTIQSRGNPQDHGEVYIDGKLAKGDNPQTRVTVGKHRICVVNSKFGIAWKQTVNVPPHRIYVDMTKARPGSCP